MAYAALASLYTTITDLENSSHIYLSPISVPILTPALSLKALFSPTFVRNLIRAILLYPRFVSLYSHMFVAINSLHTTMRRLDGSSKSYSRKNVNALDERIKEAIWKFEDLLDSHLYDQIFPQSHILGSGTVVEVRVDELRDDIESFIKQLEELEKEYMYELDHLSPEEDVGVDVISSASAGSGEKNCKIVGSSHEYILWSIGSDLEML